MSNNCGLKVSALQLHKLRTTWPRTRVATVRTNVIMYATPENATFVERSTRLARLRAQEMLFEDEQERILLDPFARVLCGDAVEYQGALSLYDAFDLVSAKFVDDFIIHATSLVNKNKNQEYRQVVLVGDGMCTRFARLLWPEGTVIFLVAPGEVHERAEALLVDSGAQVPKGCLFRRIDYDFKCPGALLASLKSKGFRGDRLSLWCLQGIRGMEISRDVLSSLLTDVANGAAFESLVVGEVPCMMEGEVESLLAQYGLVGTCTPMQVLLEQMVPSSKNKTISRLSPLLAALHSSKPLPRLVKATQRRLSLEEMEMYEIHVAAAEDVDEDFFGNFS